LFPGGSANVMPMATASVAPNPVASFSHTGAAARWHARGAEEIARELASDVHQGLTAADAAARLVRDGQNIITTKKGRAWWVRLLLQFNAPLVYILIGAAGVTLFLGEYVDSGVIFGSVLVSAIIGYVQESKAVKAIDALSRSLRIQSTVLRDGQRRRVDAADLVVGDVVYIEPGDKVPADLRLAAVTDLHVDESMLTGESKTVSKKPEALAESAELADRKNMAYAGSMVTRGTGEGVVVAAGDATEVGRINQMIVHADDIATPLTRKIAAFSRVLLWVILAVALVTFIVGIVRGNPWAEMFKAAVALAVGAIPEGLPAVVTIMLAVGVSRMARRKAIIRNLPAVEALGSTTVICSDKTGTLTQNQMTVRAAWVQPTRASAAGTEYEFTGAGYDPAGMVRVSGAAKGAEGERIAVDEHPALREMLICGALCNDAELLKTHGAAETGKGTAGQWEIRGDPTEAALLVSAQKVGAGAAGALTQESLAKQFPRVDAIPFESDQRYMATLHTLSSAARGDEQHNERVIYIKGSVERVLGMCNRAMDVGGRIVTLDKAAVQAAAADLAGRGLRVLAFARCGVQDAVDDLTPRMVEQARDGATGVVFLGVQGMLDPPRAEAIEAIARCQRAGITVKMITGDNAITAATIAGMIGIDGARGGQDEETPHVLTGAEMAAIADDALPAQAEATAVFARMTPEQKLRLVKALQSRGHIVAMTGDGVNDAPALRQADIGVAMGITGTEVAKDAADMVLADDNFASIEAAVEEGRSVFSNLTKFIMWELPCNGGEALVIVAAILLGSPLPILPVQALYINLVTSVLLGIPLVFEAKEPRVMSRPPRDPKKPLLTFELIMRTGLVSLLLGAGAIGLFHWELARGMSEATARSAAVSFIVVGQLFCLFPTRALLRPAWAVPLFSNMWLWAGIAATLATQYAFAHAPIFNRLFHSAPLDASAWGRVLLASAGVLVVVEGEKAIRRALGRARAA